jgi:chromate transport protein ChrA
LAAIPLLQASLEELKIIIALFYLIWLYGWAKRQIGSPFLSALFSIIIVYICFFYYPFLLFLPFLLFVFAYFFRGMFEKLPERERKPDYLRE